MGTSDRTLDLYKKISVAVIYLDFCRAFNLVPLDRLLSWNIKVFAATCNIGWGQAWRSKFLKHTEVTFTLQQCRLLAGPAWSGTWTTDFPGTSCYSAVPWVFFMFCLYRRLEGLRKAQWLGSVQNHLMAIQRWRAGCLLPLNEDKCVVLHLRARIISGSPIKLLTNRPFLRFLL